MGELDHFMITSIIVVNSGFLMKSIALALSCF